jgi:hypothetical protein
LSNCSPSTSESHGIFSSTCVCVCVCVCIQIARPPARPSQRLALLWLLLFVLCGGTECAPMSTSEDINIAIKYGATGLQSVLIRIRTTGFMNLGAALRWLSAFPFEEELLYPPGTYLKPLRPKPHVFKIGNSTFKVIDVEPQLS